MRPVALRPFLTEGLPLSLVREEFHRQNEAVNDISGGPTRILIKKIKTFKNSGIGFYIMVFGSQFMLESLVDCVNMNSEKPIA